MLGTGDHDGRNAHLAACGNSANHKDPRPDLQASDDTSERLMATMTTTQDGLLQIKDEAGAKAILGETNFATFVDKVGELNIKIAGGAAPRLSSVWDLASMEDNASSDQHSARVKIEGCQGCVNHVKCTFCVLWIFCLSYGKC